jgi:hypothetical protein
LEITKTVLSLILAVITILTVLTTIAAVYAGDYALQPSKHFFKSNGNPSVNAQPLDDTTTTMQPIEENNADTLQPSKDNMEPYSPMETKMLMDKNIVH